VSLTAEAVTRALGQLASADVEPILVPTRPPVLHVVYGGAHLFRSDTIDKLSALAQRSFATYAPDAGTFAAAIAIDPTASVATYDRVRARLVERAVEDYRIDFEDGYGQRDDEEEDSHAKSAAKALAEIPVGTETLLGIRIKSFGSETRERAIRTLDRFFDTYAFVAKAPLPTGFVVTLPKVRSATEVAVLVDLLAELERAHGFAERSLSVELMVETPEALLAPDGTCPLRAFVRAAGGRCTSLHLGSYDLMSSLGVLPPDQKLTHPICDLAKAIMQMAVGGIASGLTLSDGATTTLPIERFRAVFPGRTISEAEKTANHDVVHSAWLLHAANVRHGLRAGFLCGWDLHPAQIPARFGAVFAYFYAVFPAMKERLLAHEERARQATRVGQVFDDRATAEGLRAFFRAGSSRGLFGDESVTPQKT
jgi:citrate lyase beta subunit